MNENAKNREKGEKARRKEEKNERTLDSRTERNDQRGPQQPGETDINQKTMCERGKTTGHNNITRSEKQPQYEPLISFLDAIARKRFLSVPSRYSHSFSFIFGLASPTPKSHENRKNEKLWYIIAFIAYNMVTINSPTTNTHIDEMERKKRNNSSNTKKVKDDES